jgi:competence protein ComGC
MHADESVLPAAVGTSAVEARQSASPPPPARTPGKPRRRRRWLTLLGCLLALAAIPVAGYFYLAYLSSRELAEAIAEIEATDPRWQFDQIVEDRPNIPDVENPAVVVGKVETLLRGVGDIIGQENYNLFDDLPPLHQLNGRQGAVLRRALAKHEEALKLGRTLKRFQGEGQFPIRFVPDVFNVDLDPLQRSRSVARLLQFDAILRAEDDDAAGAMESCQAILVTARSIGTEPFLVAALIRYAVQAIAVAALERTLAQCQPAASELEAVQELLAKEIDAPILLHGLRGERAGLDQILTRIESGELDVSTLMGTGGGARNSWEGWLLDRMPFVITRGRGDVLRSMNRTVEAAKLPIEKQRAAFQERDKAIKDSRATDLAIRILVPALSKIAEAHCRQQANLRCAMVAVAAERYRIRHKQWPTKLSDLVADGLLKDVPVDPYNGEALRYKLRPNGAVVYSVGTDGVDNGGAINRAQYLNPGVDQGFELWDVDARRQAPLPPKAGQ